jgi:hypothetical protein
LSDKNLISFIRYTGELIRTDLDASKNLAESRLF